MQQATEVERVGSLEVAQDLVFQRRMWVVQRIGWAVMAAVVVLAFVGVFGHGIASHGSATSRDGGVKVEYPRVSRHRSPETLRITPAPGAVQGDEARVSFSRETVEGMTIETVYPEPESVEAGADEITYVFKLSASGTLAEIAFDVLYEDVGRRRGEVTLDGHDPVEFSQFVLP